VTNTTPVSVHYLDVAVIQMNSVGDPRIRAQASQLFGELCRTSPEFLSDEFNFTCGLAEMHVKSNIVVARQVSRGAQEVR